jgi:hypothetical protein
LDQVQQSACAVFPVPEDAGERLMVRRGDASMTLLQAAGKLGAVIVAMGQQRTSAEVK